MYQTAIGRHGDWTCTAESGAVRTHTRYHCDVRPAYLNTHFTYVEVICLEICLKSFKRFLTIWYKVELTTTYILYVLFTAKIHYWSFATWKEIQLLRSFIIISFVPSLRQRVASFYVESNGIFCNFLVPLLKICPRIQWIVWNIETKTKYHHICHRVHLRFYKKTDFIKTSKCKHW